MNESFIFYVNLMRSIVKAKTKSFLKWKPICWGTTGLKPRQFLKALGKNLVWPSCRASFREQILVLRIAEHPPITTENGFQFLKNWDFFNIFFLKPGPTKTFYLAKYFLNFIDGAALFMLENFKTILKKIGASTSKSGLAKFDCTF